jgi:hypothetical protein
MKRASRTGPCSVINDGTLLSAFAAVALSICGFVAGLVPPTSGAAWQAPQFSRLNGRAEPGRVRSWHAAVDRVRRVEVIASVVESRELPDGQGERAARAGRSDARSGIVTAGRPWRWWRRRSGHHSKCGERQQRHHYRPSLQGRHHHHAPARKFV